MARNKGRGPVGASPRIDHARKRWVRTDGIEFIHYAVPEGTRKRGEGQLAGWGISHILSIIYKKGSVGTASFELTEMTLEELEAVKKLFDTVFDEAREVCELRDRLAQEAYEDGDDSHYRLYRTVPTMVER